MKSYTRESKDIEAMLQEKYGDKITPVDQNKLQQRKRQQERLKQHKQFFKKKEEQPPTT